MKPNFVWITTDHQLYQPHISINKQFHLKNYERISRAGIHYPNAYTCCPLCSPARSSMLTGVYPHKHGVINNNFKEIVKDLAATDAPFFHTQLKENGYRTAWFGKWHCGDKSTAADCGFEGFSLPNYGCPYETEEYQSYIDRKGIESPQIKIEWSAKMLPVLNETYHVADQSSYPQNSWGPFETTGHMITPKEGHEAYFLTSLACDWIKNLSSDEPFLLKLELWGPHHPYHVADPFYNSIDPESIQLPPNFDQEIDFYMPDTYRSSVRRWACLQHHKMTTDEWKAILARAYEHSMLVDDAVGGILDYLEESGLMENTVVIFTSDHGDLLASHSGLFNKDSVMTEETMNVPLAMCGKNIPENKVDDSFVTNLDIPVTILELAGLTPPAAFDGKNLLSEEKRDFIFSEEYGELLINQFQRYIAKGSLRYTAHLNDMDEFYNLNLDPYQTRNMICDPDCVDDIADCRRTLLSEMDRLKDNCQQSQQLREQINIKLESGDETAFLKKREEFFWI